jgi:hypothetical protein
MKTVEGLQGEIRESTLSAARDGEAASHVRRAATVVRANPLPVSPGGLDRLSCLEYLDALQAHLEARAEAQDRITSEARVELSLLRAKGKADAAERKRKAEVGLNPSLAYIKSTVFMKFAGISHATTEILAIGRDRALVWERGASYWSPGVGNRSSPSQLAVVELDRATADRVEAGEKSVTYHFVSAQGRSPTKHTLTTGGRFGRRLILDSIETIRAQLKCPWLEPGDIARGFCLNLEEA